LFAWISLSAFAQGFSPQGCPKGFLMTDRIASRGSDAGFEVLRLRLARKLWRSAERQADAIRKRLTPDQPGAEAERDAKILAVLARTLRDLSASTIETGAAVPEPYDPDEERSTDGLRESLRLKLAELMAKRDAVET
jgi:hypothetical protein